MPNIGWDPKAHDQRDDDARASRGGISHEKDLQLDARPKDRDMGAEGGLVVDEEHNPLSHHENMTALKQAENMTKQVARLAWITSLSNLTPSFFLTEDLGAISTFCQGSICRRSGSRR